MTVLLRAATAADVDGLAALGGQAFAVARTPVHPADRPYLVAEHRRVVGEDGDRLVAHAGAWSFGQWFGGGRLPCAGVAGVSVTPEARGGGVGTALVTHLLRTVRDQGDVIATLYPMNHRFYRSLGFGPSSVRRRDRVPTRELARTRPPAGPGGGTGAGGPALAAGPADQVTLRPATPDDVPGMEAVIVRRARTGNGLLDHEPRHAARLAGRGSESAYTWVAEDATGTVVGFLASAHVPAVAPGELFSVSVTDLAADDVAVEAALWRLVGADHPGARTAEVALPAGALPRLAGEREITAVSDFTLMSRLLDVEGALLARGWPAGSHGELLLDVVDPVFADNAGPLLLTVRSGVPAVARGGGIPGRGAGPVTVDIATLSSLVTGYLDPVAAARAGLLPGASPEDLATMRRLLAGPAPHTVEFF